MQVIENSGYGADKFTMVRNNDGTGSLKIVQPLDYEDQLQSNGFRFRIQVNDKVIEIRKSIVRDDQSHESDKSSTSHVMDKYHDSLSFSSQHFSGFTDEINFT